jgi:hypothetical protein
MAAPFRFLYGKSSERNGPQRHLGCRKVPLVARSFQHLGNPRGAVPPLAPSHSGSGQPLQRREVRHSGFRYGLTDLPGG